MAKEQPSRAAAAAVVRRLDDLDRQILIQLGEDAELTNKALAGRLGLAESTCAYRIRALREAGVILGSRLQLDLALLGYPLQAIVKVRLGGHSQALVDSLYADLAATPGVLQAIHVAGADDFHLHVAVADAEALRDLILKHITVHRIVRQTETHLIFEVRSGPGVLGSARAAGGVPARPRRREV